MQYMRSYYLDVVVSSILSIDLLCVSVLKPQKKSNFYLVLFLHF